MIGAPGQLKITTLSSSIPQLLEIPALRQRHWASKFQRLTWTGSLSGSIRISSPPYVLLKPFKTFLHIKDLVDTKAQMFSNSHTAHFELFTRVLYSSRENFTHKQFFQFRDLLKETPPYLNGTLRDWKTLPLAEQALNGFIKKQRAGTKCYCLCTLIPDRRSALGWSAVVKDIRPISWKEIRLIVDRLGLTDLDRSPTIQ